MIENLTGLRTIVFEQLNVSDIFPTFLVILRANPQLTLVLNQYQIHSQEMLNEYYDFLISIFSYEQGTLFERIVVREIKVVNYCNTRYLLDVAGSTESFILTNMKRFSCYEHEYENKKKIDPNIIRGA